MLNKTVFHLAVVAALLGTSGIVLAASSNSNVPVSASVTQNCTISTSSALAFSAYDPVIANATVALNATGQVSIACTKGSSGLTIGMDNGGHVSGAQRQMLGGTSASMLQYNLFQPPSNTPGTACTFPGITAWNATGGGLLTLANAPSKAVRLYNVCGTIPAGQDVPADSYSDIVSVAINF